MATPSLLLLVSCSLRLFVVLLNHVEERFLNQAQAQAPSSALFLGYSRSIPQDRIVELVSSPAFLKCEIQKPMLSRIMLIVLPGNALNAMGPEATCG
jgi:hypothetical protein